MMESKQKNLGRSYLVDALRKKGLSRRDSTRIVNCVFREMTEALRRGEEVEFPFGTLQRVRHKHSKTRGWFLNRITSTYKKPYTVKHELDEKGYKLLNDEKEESRPLERLPHLVRRSYVVPTNLVRKPLSKDMRTRLMNHMSLRFGPHQLNRYTSGRVAALSNT